MTNECDLCFLCNILIHVCLWSYAGRIKSAAHLTSNMIVLNIQTMLRVRRANLLMALSIAESLQNAFQVLHSSGSMLCQNIIQCSL